MTPRSILILALVSSACGATFTPPVGFDSMTSACSTTNEPLLVLTIGLGEFGCSEVPGEKGLLSISLPDLSITEVPTVLEVEGSARYCDASGDNCSQSLSGTITIHGWESGVAVQGDYNLEFQEGNLEGSFDGEWCDSDVICA
jgi:hypothetical protein